MKPKTFTYNQIIQLFQTNRLPLSERQIHMIGNKVKEEMAKLEEYHSKKKAKKEAKVLKKLEKSRNYL
jgi:hypothetical protein